MPAERVGEPLQAVPAGFGGGDAGEGAASVGVELGQELPAASSMRQ